MTNLGGYMGKVLEINLSTKQVSEFPWSNEDRKNYLGGKIQAVKIFSEFVSTDTLAYDEENIVIISTGPLALTQAPSSSRYHVSSISPITNKLESSSSGGDFGIFLKKAGIDTLIITGTSQEKVWIEITEQQVFFHDANNLWGLTTSKTQEQLIELSNNSGRLVIGPAGENLVKYAKLFNQDKSLGIGIGAIFGVKNLKAITAFGNKLPDIKHKNKFHQLNQQWIQSLVNHYTYNGDQNSESCISCPITCHMRSKSEYLSYKKIADEFGLDVYCLGDSINYANRKNIQFNDITQLIQDISFKEGIGKELSEQVKVKEKKVLDDYTEAISSAGICLFNLKTLLKGKKQGLFTKLPYAKAIKYVTNMKISNHTLKMIGKRGNEIEKAYNEKRD